VPASERAVYAAYRAAAWLAQTLPYPAADRLARVAGAVAPHVMRERHAMVARHQQRIAGGTLTDDELRRRVRATFDSYARYWFEIFRLPVDVRRGEIAPHFTIEGYEHIQASVLAGHGTVLALPHLGGWEWAGAWMAEQGHKLLAVVEPVEPAELFEWFADQRNAFGLDIVPLGPGVSNELLRALRDNRIVCLLSDRDLTGDGVEVEFFGERTTLPAGPATLALRTGAALLPVAAYFAPGRAHPARVLPPVDLTRRGRLREDIARITQVLASDFERLIREAPEQWHLLQPNWPSDRAGGTDEDPA
jgi:phosphatidylinositol dimannoside acyltransferase